MLRRPKSAYYIQCYIGATIQHRVSGHVRTTIAELNHIDKFIAGSNAFLDELLRIGIDKEKTEFIYHGVPIDLYKSMAYNEEVDKRVITKLKLKPDDNLIVCSTRIDKRKGLDTFIEGCGLLKKKLKKKKFVFLVTGKPKTDQELKYQQDLFQKAADWKIKGRAKFMSFDANELPVVYRIAKASVLASFKEGLGLVLLESLAVRTPIIGSRVIGIKEVILEPGTHGLGFEYGDYRELGENLVDLFTDNNLYEKLKKEGYKRLRMYFCSKKMADNTLKLYKRLLQN